MIGRRQTCEPCLIPPQRRAGESVLRAVLEVRVLAAMTVATGVGSWGVLRFPMPVDNVFLALIQLREPFVLNVLAYGYATL